MKLRTPKANYKIFDKKRQGYLTKSGGKSSTWSSITWVMRAAHEMAASYNSSKKEKDKYCEDYIEIHVFPIANAVIVTYTEMLESQKQVEQERENKKAEAQQKRDVIRVEQRKQEIQDTITKLQKELQHL